MSTAARLDTARRVFVAGATGAIGAHLIPLLLARGDAGMTRSASKAAELDARGVESVVVALKECI